LFAVRILALVDEKLRDRLKVFVAAQAEIVREKDARVREQYGD